MWYNEIWKDGDVVLSSRGLARNLDGVPFPLAANENSRRKFLINAGVRFLTKAIIRLKSLI